MTTRVLIVEDSTSFRKLIATSLRRHGYWVFEAWSLESARKLLPAIRPSILLLDLQLSDGEGRSLLEQGLTEDAFTIVISSRAGEQDKVGCLSLGAEDYIVKPVDIAEMLLRIKRFDRLIKRDRSPLADFGEFFVDFATRRVILPNGDETILSLCEYKLLRLFAAAEGEILSRASVSQQLHNRQQGDASRAVDVMVSKLRRKLDPTGRASPIRSVRGEGYRFAPRRRDRSQ